MSKDNENVNFYQHPSMKKHIVSYHNPCFSETQMTIPCRVGIIAPSGAGKSVALLNYIARCKDTFFHIYLVIKQDEPLYQLLREKVGAKNITTYTKLTDLPMPKDLNIGLKQVLMVFDDYVVDKHQEKIEEYFIRGRKVGGGISIFYLSQNYFSIPPIIRRQFNYLIILKLSGSRDLNLILRNYSLGVDIKQLTAIYKDAAKIKFDFLKLDCDNPDENKKFSKNWNSFYKITNESDDEK